MKPHDKCVEESKKKCDCIADFVEECKTSKLDNKIAIWKKGYSQAYHDLISKLPDEEEIENVIRMYSTEKFVNATASYLCLMDSQYKCVAKAITKRIKENYNGQKI